MQDNFTEMGKREAESELAHHKRLVYGKLVDKTLADSDYSELSKELYGQEYSSDVARRMMYGSCKTLQLMDEENERGVSRPDILSELDQKKIELQKERQKFFDQRTAFNKVVRERARQEELNEILLEAIRSGDLPRLEYVQNDVVASDNDLLVSLNDIHYGANIRNYWNSYDSDICRDMMRAYLDTIISTAHTHHSENCIVWANGDLISGNIHYSIAMSNKENVIQQVKGVSELISEFLAELSHHFKMVRFVSVSGNHSRIERNKDKSLVGERLDDLIGWYLEARLQDFENIFVLSEMVETASYKKVDDTMYLIDVRGKTYCGVHGDFDGSDKKIQALKTMAGTPVYAVLSGHLHHTMVDEVQGTKVIMSGSFIGMDGYCVEQRIVGHPEQMICVCDETGVRCFYPVDLSDRRH